MFFADDPIIGNEKKMPIYLVNIGKTMWQYHIIRPEGFWKPQIIYCTEGSGTLIFNGEKHRIEPYMGFYLPEDIPHEYYSDGDVWDTHWVVLDGFACKQMLSEMGLDRPKVFRLTDHEELERKFGKMHDALVRDNAFGNYRASALLYDFLIELYRILSGTDQNSSPSAAVVRAVDYINAHYKEKVTLSDLSREAGITEQHLCRLFKKSLGCRPSEYIIKRRLKEVKRLLAHTRLPIETIALNTGFCSSGYLSMMFRRYEDTTPGEYRCGHTKTL